MLYVSDEVDCNPQSLYENKFASVFNAMLLFDIMAKDLMWLSLWKHLNYAVFILLSKHNITSPFYIMLNRVMDY